jgi:2-amino-4-hydroxy-6-hydroxymethyldihydropteridine diphosphokinase
LTLPHPRLAQRDFVLLPLEEVSFGWQHPVTGDNIRDMLGFIFKNGHSNNCKRLQPLGALSD